ncbi:hypothetical protein [uncultured Aliiroseovarius sp.]|uniref:hypothetical protein n=1 Tax=uncultured Aliiroseovarius sp. TaxID=1658783 RepID=UPI0025922EEF|nr:hypothetical protein [uncultured Aliiroseovarius sp.]
MDIFNAGVQYDDFQGTVAADESDVIRLKNYLVENTIMTDSEGLVGLRFGFGGNHASEMTELACVAYVLQANAPDGKVDHVRAVEFSIPTTVLFSYFKRFDLVMTRKGIDLSTAEVDGAY